MPDLFSFLAQLSTWSLYHLVLPIAVWTVGAAFIHLAIEHQDRLHPIHTFAIRHATLFALPLALLVAPLFRWTGAPAPIDSDGLAGPVPGGALEQAPAVLALPEPSLLPVLGGLLVVLLAMFSVIALIRVGRALLTISRMGHSLPDGPVLQERLDGLRSTWGVDGSVRALVSTDAASPLTFGWRRPVVIVPESLISDPDGLDLALAHELVHIRRSDFADQLMAETLRALFIWHPLLTILTRALAADRECVCDAEVLAQTPSSRTSYARLLVTHTTATAPALAVGIARRSLLHTRLEAMQRHMLPSNLLAARRSVARFFSVAVLGLVTLLGGMGAASMAPDATIPSYGTADIVVAPDTNVFVVVEEMPVLRGGLEELTKRLRYPESAAQAGIQGRVYVEFIVDPNGRVIEPIVRRGIGGGADEEAVRLIRSAEFTPGRQKGERVSVRLTIPITFRLNNGE